MGHYIARRVLLVIPTFFLATSMAFFMLRILPGDELTLIIGEETITAEDRSRLEARYGLDAPLYERYGDFLYGVVQGDLGSSIFDGRSVLGKLKLALPVTVELALMSIVISLMVAIPVGVISALTRDTLLDYVLRLSAILGLSVPVFVTATVALLGLTIWVGWTPALRYTPFIDDPIDNLSQFIIPALLLGTVLAASVMRMTRSMMLDVLNQDYVRTARAKGLRERNVVVRHALRNALLPVVTLVGLQMGIVISGTVILESIYALPGMGTQLIRALNNRDLAVVQGIQVIVIFWVLLVNLVIDLSYTVLDPRVSLR